MAYPDIKISSSLDAKGFKQAETASRKLEKNIKNLAKTFGIAFGAKAVVNFAQSSAKAFIEDDNAARSLGVTIKNLGLNYDNNIITIGRFIDNLEQQTGVLDDELRPAMDRLLRATGSVTKSQELLNLSLDIAAGTGKTVEQVSQSLQKAYLGQTAAIGRLGVGISKAELATGKFADIQQKLTTLFAGQAASAANSYAGQLAKLQVAANNAKETIGKGLVDALKLLSGDTSIDQLNAGLEKTSLYIADIIRGIGVFIQKLKDIPVAGKAFQLPLDAYVQAIPVIGAYISILANMGAEMRKLDAQARRMFTGGSGGPSRDFVKEREAKAAAAKIKADKLAASNKIKADKLAAANKAKLDKAAAVFDLEKIQIAAALKGKISEEEKTRLLLMQAIANEDADKAETLAKKLEDIQKKNAQIAADLLAIGQTDDPFATWSGSLAAALIELNKVGERMFEIRQKESGYKDTSMLSGNTFPKDATPEQVLAIVEEAVAIAEKAAADAAISVAQTQTVTDALAQSANAAVAIAENLGIIDTANVLGVSADIANQAQSSSIFKPGATPLPTLLEQAGALIAAGSNAGAGTSSSMFNPYGGSVGGPGFGNAVNYNYVTVEVAGSVLSENDLDEVINRAMLNNIRRGLTQSPAGSLP